MGNLCSFEENKHIEQIRIIRQNRINEQYRIWQQQRIKEQQRIEEQQQIKEQNRIKEQQQIEEQQRIEEQQQRNKYILENIKNIGTIKTRYSNYINLLFQQNPQDNLNDDTKYFFLIFDETRKILYDSEYKNTLALTNDGIDLLFANNDFQMLTQNRYGVHKLFTNNKYEYLSYENKLYYIIVKKYYNLMTLDICKYIIEKIRKKCFHRTYHELYKFVFHDEFDYDLNGYNADEYDANGYNASGFDIYGHEKKNNKYNPLKFYGHHLKFGYNEGGYNIYGYNAYGFNRRGYYCDDDFLFNIIMISDNIIISELSKYEIFYDVLEKSDKIKFMLEKKSGCIFLLNKNSEKYCDIIYKNNDFLNLLLDYENGRQLLLNDDKARHLLVGNENGQNLLMNNGYEKIIFEYYKKANNIIYSFAREILCPLCREQNNSYEKKSDNEQCCICLENTNDIKMNNCAHYFCENCMKQIAK